MTRRLSFAPLLANRRPGNPARKIACPAITTNRCAFA